MNKYLKKKPRKNKGKAITLAILSVILAAMLLLVWKLESGSQAQLPEAPVIPETQTTEAQQTTGKPATEAPETEPEETEEEIIIETLPEVDAPEAGSITYAEYLKLDPLAQQAYYNKFESPDDFFLWLNTAKEEYNASTEPMPTIGSGGEVELPGSTENSSETEASEETQGGLEIEDEGVEDW